MRNLIKLIVTFVTLFVSQNIFGQSGWSSYSIPDNNITDISFSNSNLGWAVDMQAHIFKTTNSGLNWDLITVYAPYPSGGINCVKAFSDGTILASSDDFRPVTPPAGVIMKSTDGGMNWTMVYRTALHTNITMYFLNTQEGWGTEVGGGTSSLWVNRTTNGGNNWSVIYTLSPYPGGASAPFFINSTTGWFLDKNTSPKIYKTVNSGFNWTTLPLSSVYNDIYFFNESTGLLCGEGVIKTTDGGNTWVTKLSESALNKILFINQQTGWTFGNAGKIWKTTNSGENWSSDTSYGRKLIAASFINQNTGWILGEAGMLLRTINSGVLVKQTSIETPNNFSLSQNYPNPFNPSTRINYDLRNSNFVSLKVFDMLGKEVASLVNEKQNTGSYSVDFNSSEFNLPSGIYFYTLNAGEFKETRKMVLVK